MADAPAHAPTASRNCDGRTAPRAIRLPVIGPDGSPIRPSRSGKWRAMSLILVHVLIVAHVLHWLSSGRTVSPVEPSEAMETIKLGRINAGFLFFAGALVATAVVGRWLCGWGCHLVAYQDLTLFILKKLSLRPRAFRTRLLMFVPLLAALYMFVWPAVYRLFAGLGHPPLTWHVARTGFWDTFPGVAIAALTVLTCGVAIIYFLGPKGFCTYACPYGAFFGLTDKLAVGRIRVTDACHQCGHCTAVCTSNVNVAAEVKLHKMVVDPGCMKCLDCVSVCPNDALYFGFGRTALGLTPASRKSDLLGAEEIVAFLVFGGAFLAYRGLYGVIPFLMSLGCAGITTFVLIKAFGLVSRRDVLLQKVVLKSDGRVRPTGLVFAVWALLLLAFTAHCGWWQYHSEAAERLLADLPTESWGWQRAGAEFADLSNEQKSAMSRARAHLDACTRWGLFATDAHEFQLAWLDVLQRDAPAAVGRIRRFLDRNPEQASYWVKLANYETHCGNRSQARQALDRALALDKSSREPVAAKHPGESFPQSALVLAEWGAFLADEGDANRAGEALREAVRLDPESAQAWLTLGAFFYSKGRIDEARASLIRACENAPGAPAPLEILERVGREEQDFSSALKDCDAALARSPKTNVLQHNRAYALVRLRRYDEATAAYRELISARPDLIGLRAELGATRLAMGDVPGAIVEYEAVVAQSAKDSESQFKLAFLYQQAGRTSDAIRHYQKVIDLGGPERDLAREALTRLKQ